MAKRVFDKYEIIRRLAVGGMGEIFLARESGVVNRLVILKALLPDLAEDKEAIEWFLDEARVAAVLNHPNIISIYEVGAWQGMYFIVMEYVAGASLAQLIKASIKSDQPLVWPIAAHIIASVAGALDYAHHETGITGEPLNVVHRDISPQNIMVRLDGVAKVLDFGIARAANRSSRTQTGVVKGKIGYMPPEVLIEKNYDSLCDQYSLGIVLWELLARKRLFRSGGGDLDIARRIVHGKIPPISGVVPGLPIEFDAIIARMCSKDPAQRYARLGQVADALGQVQKDYGAENQAAAVATWVKDLLGQSISEQTGDLTPVADDFLIDLRGSHAQAGVQTDSWSAFSWTRRFTQKKRGRIWLALAGSLLLLLGLAWMLVPGAGPNKSVELTTTVTPTPAAVPAPGVPSQPSAPTPATLRIASAPPGATVYVDQKQRGTTPFESDALSLKQTHQVELRLDGYQDSRFEISLESGQIRDVQIALAKKQSRRARTPRVSTASTSPVRQVESDGYLILKTIPWTTVSIDGTPQGPTPLFRVRLSAGVHKLRLVNEAAGIDHKRQIKVLPDKTLKLTWKLK